METRIGIGLTVHNRPEVAIKCIANIKKFMPKDCKFVIVDDASEIPFKGANYRFEKNVGIASAKNMCLELLDGCDEIFLFDEDCWPIVKNWHLPYIESDQPHLCFTFNKLIDGRQNGNRLLISSKGLNSYQHPCGCMLYINKICLEKVGGFDPDYGRYGYEHVNFSVRVFNSGLTRERFLDVPNSLELFHSMDYAMEVKSSVPSIDRAASIAKTRQKYQRELKSAAYIPFKEAKGVVLTTYLTGCVDPQHGQKWDADIEQVRTLAESVKRNGTELVVINDCFEDKQVRAIYSTPYEAVTLHNNPYFNRWRIYLDYLINNKHDNVWLVDATDTELLRHPFKSIQPGKLYVGWEKQVIGCQWMLNHHKSNFSQTFINCNMKTPLLNAGVIGGRYEIVMEFLDRICDMIGILPELELDSTDMATFNWVLYSHFNGRFETGEKICTTFKAYSDNGKAIWRHK